MTKQELGHEEKPERNSLRKILLAISIAPQLWPSGKHFPATVMKTPSHPAPLVRCIADRACA